MAEVSLKKRVWGWFFFDWASQPYSTLLLTFIFGPYIGATIADALMAGGLSEDAAEAQAQSTWALAQTLSGLAIAFCAPVLGAIADSSGYRMRWIKFFSAMYVFGAGALWFTYSDGSTTTWMLFAFAIGFIGYELATIFTNSILPDLGNRDEIGEISGSGFAFGYLGGVLALVLMLLLFADEGGKTLLGITPLLGLDSDLREGTRFVGPFTAIWYAFFMIFFFRWVKEPPQAHSDVSVPQALAQLWQTIKTLKQSVAAYLVSSMVYRDALNGLYGFGGIYAKLVLDWPIIYIGVFGIVGAITAAIFSWIGGKADSKYGPKPVIVISILTLMVVCAVIVGMTREGLFGIAFAAESSMPDIIFFICGAVIGAAGGTIQASSRSMMVRHTHPDRPTEAFGLYALSGKATAFLAPALIGIVTTITQSPRLGVSPLIGLFAIGLVLLIWVKPEGERPQL
ncbi:MFS transporter [Cochlodiniinecator piscidefendens]|uniref:MFS transporter n=1 Tax=Cochlodiniinecator piscidefendens TaxID=2715756 RepID=UPI00140B02FA|nr:MFS transporter [Cochlodiniinecator piscidefendens]